MELFPCIENRMYDDELRDAQANEKKWCGELVWFGWCAKSHIPGQSTTTAATGTTLTTAPAPKRSAIYNVSAWKPIPSG